jgi:alcohol dehydrogenase class IV
LLARVAIVDPELTYSLPPSLTASTGMDALTQVIEPWVSAKANPLTDGFCLEGMSLAARSLARAYEKGSDASARENMSLTSLLGGLALANAGLGAVHGFAAPLGGMFPAPHGAVCAVLLPHSMRVNIEALHAREPASPVLDRYQEVARRLTSRADARCEDGIKWVSELCAALRIPPLRTYGIAKDDLPVISEKAAVASSMKANPIALTAEERLEILESAY